MASTPLFQLDSLNAYLLCPTDKDRVQRLLEACAAFSLMTHGEPPDAVAGEATFAALPEGKDYEDKYVIGLAADDTGDLVGLIDLIQSHPEPDEWFIGLLLLHPEARGRGVGAATYQAIVEWAKSQGVKAIRLGVVNQNKAGRRFWKRLGFVEVTRRLMHMGRKESIILTLRHPLP